MLPEFNSHSGGDRHDERTVTHVKHSNFSCVWVKDRNDERRIIKQDLYGVSFLWHLASFGQSNIAPKPQLSYYTYVCMCVYIWEGSLTGTWCIACMLMACRHWTACQTAPVYRGDVWE